MRPSIGSERHRRNSRIWVIPGCWCTSCTRSPTSAYQKKAPEDGSKLAHD